MLYRGVPSVGYDIESAMLRRMRGKSNADIPEELFINANALLIERAKIRGYNINLKSGNEMSDLEIMAELQHYGAATCLIDFTLSPLVALWFACQVHPGKNQTDGKVVAINADNEENINFTSDDVNKKSIQECLGKETNPESPHVGKIIRIWEPKHQNNRIVAQQSVFVFGPAEIVEGGIPPYVVEEPKKLDILDELRAYGISEESLFCDFDGFARILNTYNQPYSHSAEDYYRIGDKNSRNGNHELAINFYDMALSHSSPCEKAFFGRGMAYFHLQKWEKAIEDYSETIRRKLENMWQNAYEYRVVAKTIAGHHQSAIDDCDWIADNIRPQNPIVRFLRGVAQANLGNHQAAINDFTETIKLGGNPAIAYYNRGNSKFNLNEHRGAIADYSEVIKINPQHASAYYNRGVAKLHIGDKEGAMKDFQEADKIDPYMKIPDIE